MGFEVDNVALDSFFSENVGLPLSVSFHKCCVPFSHLSMTLYQLSTFKIKGWYLWISLPTEPQLWLSGGADVTI